MSYRLKYNPGVEAVHDALPQAASEAMTLALAAACHDPIGATEPYGEDDGVTRVILTDHAFAVLLVGQLPPKTVFVLEMTYLG